MTLHSLETVEAEQNLSVGQTPCHFDSLRDCLLDTSMSIYIDLYIYSLYRGHLRISRIDMEMRLCLKIGYDPTHGLHPGNPSGNGLELYYKARGLSALVGGCQRNTSGAIRLLNQVPFPSCQMQKGCNQFSCLSCCLCQLQSIACNCTISTWFSEWPGQMQSCPIECLLHRTTKHILWCHTWI